jgi:hypothetical protein
VPTRILPLILALYASGCTDDQPMFRQPDLAGLDLAVQLDLAPPDLAPTLPAPTVLGPASTLTSCLAVDANGIYWADQGPPKRVVKMPLAGAAVPTLMASGGDDRACVVIDSVNAYFVDSDRIVQVPLAGGSAIAIASNQHPLKSLVAVQGTFVYFVTDVYGNVDAYNGKNAIMRVPVGGGTVEVVSATLRGSPGGLAADANNIYYSDLDGMFALPKAGGTAQPLGMSTVHSNAFEINSTSLALVEIQAIGMGDVAVMRLDGGGRVVVSQTLASNIAVDGSGVYAQQDGHLVRFALDGSGTTTLSGVTPHAIALDANFIYFTDGASILRLNK